jgi:hypothetical protein
MVGNTDLTIIVYLVQLGFELLLISPALFNLPLLLMDSCLQFQQLFLTLGVRQNIVA